MKVRYTATLIMVSVLLTVTTLGATIPGRWEKVDTLPSNTGITLSLDSGEHLEVLFLDSDQDSIRVQTISGRAHEYPKSAVRKVRLTGEKRHDPPWNGMILGAAIGAGSFLAIHAIVCCAPNAAHDAVAAGMFGAIGMGVGAAIDASFRQDEILFRAR